ncbi:MAG: hypothetical protein RL754_1247 [Bacteroidota bacterium]|jgi:hypothetical protein
MKLRRILLAVLGVLLVSAVVASRIASGLYWDQHAISTTLIDVQYPDNQALVFKSDIEPLVNTFLKESKDSNMLKANVFLLETSIEALPYVDEAQVYWNLNEALVVKVRSKQAKAKVLIGKDMHLMTTGNEILLPPTSVALNLPIITGASDSASAAAIGLVLDEVYASTVFDETNVAQLAVEGDRVKLVPEAYEHTITANAGPLLGRDLEKLAAFYAATEKEELEQISRIDLRFSNQVVTEL